MTSAISTGTPAAESCSAITCSVLVLPVPVAPGDQAVPVEHRQRDPDPRRRVDLPVDHDRAQLQRAALRPRSRRRCCLAEPERLPAAVSSATTPEPYATVGCAG